MTALPFDSNDPNVHIGLVNGLTSINDKTGEVECTVLEIGGVDKDGKPIAPKVDGLPHSILVRVPADPSEPLAWGFAPFGGFEAVANGGPVLECTKQVEESAMESDEAREAVDYMSSLARFAGEMAAKATVDKWAEEQSASESVPDDIRALLALGDGSGSES